MPFGHAFGLSARIYVVINRRGARRAKVRMRGVGVYPRVHSGPTQSAGQRRGELEVAVSGGFPYPFFN